MVEIVLLVLLAGCAEEVALDRVELHIHQPGRVVGALQKGAQAQEVEGLVLQHGAQRDPARQVRTELHPVEELGRVTLELAVTQHAAGFQPGLVLCFPGLGGERAAHRAGVLAGRTQAGDDGRRVFLVLHHELHHIALDDVAVLGVVGGQQLADGQQALPAHTGHSGGLGQQGRLVVHIQHPCGVLCTLRVTGHPEQVVSGTAQHL